MLTGVSHLQDPCETSPGWTVTEGRPAGLPPPQTAQTKEGPRGLPLTAIRRRGAL